MKKVKCSQCGKETEFGIICYACLEIRYLASEGAGK